MQIIQFKLGKRNMNNRLNQEVDLNIQASLVILGRALSQLECHNDLANDDSFSDLETESDPKLKHLQGQGSPDVTALNIFHHTKSHTGVSASKEDSQEKGAAPVRLDSDLDSKVLSLSTIMQQALD